MDNCVDETSVMQLRNQHSTAARAPLPSRASTALLPYGEVKRQRARARAWIGKRTRGRSNCCLCEGGLLRDHVPRRLRCVWQGIKEGITQRVGYLIYIG